MVYLNLFIIAFVAVFVIDYSGFIDEMDKTLTKVFRSKVPLHIPKPFSCSLCSTFWAGVIYLLCVGQMGFIPLLILGVACALTPEILSIIYFVKDFVNLLFDTVEKFIGMKR